MNVSNKPKKLSLSSLYVSTSSVPDTPSTIGNESVTETPKSSFGESFAGRPPASFRMTVEESMGGSDMLSARAMLKTSLAEKMELRQSLKALQDEVDFLRSAGGSARGRSPMMASPRVGFVSTLGPSSPSGASSLYRMASGSVGGQSRAGASGYSAMGNSLAGNSSDQAVSEYRVSIKQYRRQKNLYFRAVVYSVVLKQLRRGFRTWSAWLRALRRHEGRATRHQVTVRMLDTDARRLREMAFLRWKYSLHTLQKYDARTYQAIRVYLTRRRKWRFWTRWACCCARRRQIKRAICRRFRFARRVKTREAFYKWRTHARRLSLIEVATRNRFACSVVLVKLLFRFNFRRRIRASWLKWKLTGHVINKTSELERHLLRRLGRVHFRKLSPLSKAFAHWRHVTAVVLPRTQALLGRALNIVVARVFTTPVFGAFLRWRRVLADESRVQQLQEATTAAAANARETAERNAREAALVRVPVTDWEDRRQYLFYVRQRFVEVLARHKCQASVPTAFAWWRVFAREEGRMVVLRARVRARLIAVVDRTAAGWLQRGFSTWLAAVRRQIQDELEGRLDETGLSAAEKHEQYLALLARSKEHAEETAREKLEHQILLRNTEEQLLRMKHMLGKLTIRRVFMRRMADALQIWEHNVTLLKMLERSRRLGHERLHFSNRKHAAKFFVRLRSETVAADVKMRVTRAFLLWCSGVRMLDRKHRLARRTMSRMLYRKAACAFEQWRAVVDDHNRRAHAVVASTRILRRVGRRMVRYYLAAALRSWKLRSGCVAAGREKLRGMFRTCGKLALRTCFSRLRQSAFSHYIERLRDSMQATQVLLDDSRYDHGLDVRLGRKQLMFRLWKQRAREGRVTRSSLEAVLTASVRATAVRNAWVAWRCAWRRRCSLRRTVLRRLRAQKALFVSHWKTVTMAHMELASEVTQQTMNTSVVSVRASADRLAQDNVALVHKLKTNVALVQKLMQDMRSIIQIQDQNKLVRRMYLAWKRLAFVNHCNRRNIGAILLRHAVVNQSSAVLVQATWAHWRMLFSIRRHRRAHALYMRRCCFNSWKLLHYYSRLQRHSVLKTGDQSNRSRLFQAFVSWKFGVFVARKKLFSFLDRLLDSRGLSVRMLLRVKQRVVRVAWDGWQQFVAVRKEVAFLVRRKVRLTKSSLFLRWKRVARGRRLLRRAVAAMTHNLRLHRSTALQQQLSRAWRRWHEYISLRARTTVLSAWDKCRDTQQTVAARQFVRLLRAAFLSSRRRVTMVAWTRWRGRVQRQIALAGLLLHSCVSRRSTFAFASSVCSSPSVTRSTLLMRRFRFTVIGRALVQWRLVQLAGALGEATAAHRVRALGRMSTLVAQRSLRVSLGRWRHAAASVRLHRAVLVARHDECEKGLKLSNHFSDVYAQMARARVLACAEDFLRSSSQLEKSGGGGDTDGSSRGIAHIQETPFRGATASAGLLETLMARLQEQVVHGVFEEQLFGVLNGKYDVRVVLADSPLLRHQSLAAATRTQSRRADLSSPVLVETPAGTERLYDSHSGRSELDAASSRAPFSPSGVGASSVAPTVDLPGAGSAEPTSDRNREAAVHIQRCLKSRVWHGVVTDAGTGPGAAAGDGLRMAFIPVVHHDKRQDRSRVVAVVELVRRGLPGAFGASRPQPREHVHGRSGHGAHYVAAESIITGAALPPAEVASSPFMESETSGPAQFAGLYCEETLAQLLSAASVIHPTTSDDLDHCEREHVASMYFVHQFVSLMTSLAAVIVGVLECGSGAGESGADGTGSTLLVCQRHCELLLRNISLRAAHETERAQLGASMRSQREDAARLQCIIAGSGDMQQKLTAKLSEAAEKCKASRGRCKELEDRLRRLKEEAEAERARRVDLERTVAEHAALNESRRQSSRQWEDLVDVLRSAADEAAIPESRETLGAAQRRSRGVPGAAAAQSGGEYESPSARNAAIAALNNSSPVHFNSFRGSPSSIKQFRRHRSPRGSPSALNVDDL